jgi:hypothetical protein
MASLNFIKGSIKGKVGQFIGSSWKGIDYIKTYTPPSNPRTEGQVAVRSVFQHCAHIAKALNQDVLKPYTFPKPHKMSPYNYMMHVNKSLFAAKTWDPKKLIIFDGPLFNPGMVIAETEEDDGLCVYIEWDTEYGKADDRAIGIVHDEVSELTFYAEELREGAFLRVPLLLGGQPDVSFLHAYLAFVKVPPQDTAEPGEVSITAYKPVTVTTRETASTHKVKQKTDTLTTASS